MTQLIQQQSEHIQTLKTRVEEVEKNSEGRYKQTVEDTKSLRNKMKKISSDDQPDSPIEGGLTLDFKNILRERRAELIERCYDEGVIEFKDLIIAAFTHEFVRNDQLDFELWSKNKIEECKLILKNRKAQLDSIEQQQKEEEKKRLEEEQQKKDSETPDPNARPLFPTSPPEVEANKNELRQRRQELFRQGVSSNDQRIKEIENKLTMLK